MSHEDTRERARGSCRRPRQRGRHEFPRQAHRRRHEVAAANSARVLYGHAQPRGVGRREHARGGRLLFRARVMLLSTVDGVVWMPSSIHISPPEMFGADDAPQESRKSRTDVRFLSATATPSASQSPYQVRHSRHIRSLPTASRHRRRAQPSGPTVDYRRR